MQKVFAALFAKGHKRIVLIGGDLLPVPLSHFAQAFAYLDHPGPRAVLGPSRDGGYYLVALNQEQPALFDGMTWSHDQVLAETLAKLDAIGVHSKQLPPWFDIDTVDDLQRVFRTKRPQQRAMKNTLRLLHRLRVLKRCNTPVTDRAESL